MEAARMIDEVITEVRGRVGFITLNRPRALNALSLPMIRALTQALIAWQAHPQVDAVAIRGQGKEGPFGAFCAGGDIRFFHQAALAGNPELEDFFTEEYALNHLIHHYPKPYVAFLDGIVMGGGMGISGHGGANSLRLVTERTKMAMPETNIGLFPDVGGGWFLSRCPGRVGEYLALSGHVIGGEDAIHAGLADGQLPALELPALWKSLGEEGVAGISALRSRLEKAPRAHGKLTDERPQIDRFFGAASIPELMQALESEGGAWAAETAAALRKRSPLMLYVVLEQVRRGRSQTLAEDLRMERDLVRNAFHLRPGADSETVEGIRALAVDKDHAPRWNPARIEDVTPEMVEPFFRSPWPVHAHPLRHLG
jgi:enoyl-CoA hydratase/carnithine racemase